MRFSIFCLGYVGAGVDVDPSKLALICEGRTPVVEEGMVDLTRNVARRVAYRSPTMSRPRSRAAPSRSSASSRLPLLTDKMSMAVSLECCVALLDHRLFELAASIPENVKLRGGRLKHVMKSTLRDLLPADILERRKRGFGTPMGAWFKGALSQLLRQLLSPESVRRRGVFRYPAVASLIAAHDVNRIDGTDRLLALANFEIWARLYLDARAPADVVDELRIAA